MNEWMREKKTGGSARANPRRRDWMWTRVLGTTIAGRYAGGTSARLRRTTRGVDARGDDGGSAGGLFASVGRRVWAAAEGKRGGGGGGNRSSMRGVKKENLPTKTCVVCERPFTWRKKWENCWDEVTTCSKSCNAKRRSAKQKANREDGGADASAVGMSADEDEEGGRAKHKASVKAQKADRRARLAFEGDPTSGSKACDECSKLVNELIRCQTDVSKKWRMVCGKCWKKVSGGVVDGDANHPHYRYGGLWKNRRVQSGPIADSV